MSERPYLTAVVLLGPLLQLDEHGLHVWGGRGSQRGRRGEQTPQKYFKATVQNGRTKCSLKTCSQSCPRRATRPRLLPGAPCSPPRVQLSSLAPRGTASCASQRPACAGIRPARYCCRANVVRAGSCYAAHMPTGWDSCTMHNVGRNPAVRARGHRGCRGDRRPRARHLVRSAAPGEDAPRLAPPRLAPPCRPRIHRPKGNHRAGEGVGQGDGGERRGAQGARPRHVLPGRARGRCTRRARPAASRRSPRQSPQKRTRARARRPHCTVRLPVA